MATKQKDDAPIVVSALPSAIQRLEKLIGGVGNGNVTISPLKEKTLVSIQMQGSVAEALLPKLLPGLDSAWDFPFDALSSALLKRDSAQLTFNGGQLDIKDKRYLSTLQGVEATKFVRVEKPTEPSCSLAINSELWAALNELTSNVKIGKSLAALPDITVHFVFTKKVAMAVAFDRFQMAAYALPNTFGVAFSMTLPLPRAESLFKSSADVTTLLASDSLVYVKAGVIAFSSSLPSVEDTTGVPTEAVVERIRSLREAKFPKSVVLPKAELEKFLANARAVSNANALLKIEVGETSSRLTLSSDGNKVSAVIPSNARKPFTFKLDIGYVTTIVAKADDKIQLEVDDSALVFRTDKLIYASVLSADDEEASSAKKSRKDSEED